MIKFQLPKLHSLLAKDSSLEYNDFSKLVHVHEGYAFVLNNDLFCAVYLRDYVKNTCKLKDAEEIQLLDQILDFMSEKSYNKEFWSELVDRVDLNLNVEELVAKNDHYTKTLNYEQIEPTVSKLLEIRKELERKVKPFDQFAFDGKTLSLLVSSFSKEIKKDRFILRSTGVENCCHFALVNQNYIFGFIKSDFEGSTEIFDNFEELDELSELLS